MRRRTSVSWDRAMVTALGYVALAVVWILVSDRVVAFMPDAVEERAQTLKGLLFVGVTGVILLLLVLRWGEQTTAEARHAAAAERLLTQVVDTVPAGVLLLSGDGLVTFANPSAEALLGVSAAELVGRRLDEVGLADLPGDQFDPESMQAMLADGARIRPRAGGTARSILAKAAPVDRDGGAGGWVVALADVTDAHDARERSARLVRGYQYLSDVAMAMTKVADRTALLNEVVRLAVERGGFVGAWVYHRETGDADGAQVAFRGAESVACDDVDHVARAYSPDTELLDRLVGGEIVISNDLVHDLRSPWYSCAQTAGLGACASLALEAPNERIVVLTLFAGEPGYFDAGQIELLASVRSSLAFAVDRLALERRRLAAEEALDLSERSYRMLFEAHPQPMWVYDVETLAFLAVNNAAVAKYGYTREEFLAMTIADIRPRDDVPRLLNNVLHVSEGLDDAGIWAHVDKMGRQFPVHIYSHVMEWEGRKSEIVMVMEVARVE